MENLKSLFQLENNSAANQIETDRASNASYGVLPSDIYDGVVKYAYMDKSQGGTPCVKVVLEVNGKIIEETHYIAYKDTGLPYKTVNGKTTTPCDLITVLRAKPALFHKDIVKGIDFWHVYNSIPKNENENINNMKFKAIVGNPPYQIMDGGTQTGAVPVYNKFVDAGRQLEPNYLSMIMPAKWYNGGRNLDEFRASMLSDRHIQRLFDYLDSSEIFNTVDVAGGICYFLWNKEYDGLCSVTTPLMTEYLMNLTHTSDTMKV